jgi:uncharacterized protein YerC
MDSLDNSKLSNKVFITETPVPLSKQDHLLFNLLALVNSNNKLLQDVDQRLTYNEFQLNNSFLELNEMIEESTPLKHFSEHTELSITENTDDIEETPADPIVQKLFGKKKYIYRL